MKWLSKFKDFLVLDNFGLHLTLSFMVFTMIAKYNLILAFIVVSLAILLMEVYDKFYLKTKFSMKDILAGVIGIVLAILLKI